MYFSTIRNIYYLIFSHAGRSPNNYMYVDPEEPEAQPPSSEYDLNNSKSHEFEFKGSIRVLTQQNKVRNW